MIMWYYLNIHMFWMDMIPLFEEAPQNQNPEILQIHH